MMHIVCVFGFFSGCRTFFFMPFWCCNHSVWALSPCNRGNIKLDSKLEVRGELPQILGGCRKPAPAVLNLVEDVLQPVVMPVFSPLALNDLFLSSIALNSSCVILARICLS